jgi:MFS family permease
MEDDVTERSGSGEPVEFRKSPKKAAVSGWIGSVLEYYDFTIYASAAALVFPTIFFPKGNATVAVVASLATYAVGYLARPLGAVVLGHWGDRHGRKNVLVLCMVAMGASTFAVGLLPTYAQVGILAPILLVLLRLIQGFTVAGELGGASAMIIEHSPFGRRGYYASFSLQGTQAASVIAAAVFLPLSAALSPEAFTSWGWRIPFFLSALVVVAGYIIRRRVDETPAFREEEAHQGVVKAPVVQVFRENGANILRAVCMALVNVVGTTVVVFGAAYATQAAYGVGMSTTLYLWIPIAANIVAIILIPFFGRLSDRIGRRPLMIFGALGSGVLSIPYLFAVSQKNEALAIALAILTVGVFYQAWNATFASFFQEMFPTRTRVTGFAISQNIGLAVVAFLPTVFTIVAPPGSTNVPLIIGGLCFGITIIGAIAAWSAQETYRVHLNDLGNPDAVPVPRDEYERIRAAV